MKKIVLAGFLVIGFAAWSSAQTTTTKTEKKDTKASTSKSCCSKGDASASAPKSCCSKGDANASKSCHGSSTSTSATTTEKKENHGHSGCNHANTEGKKD